MEYFEKIRHCELESLKLGTTLVDAFNSLINGENWNDRLYQDYLVEHLGFAPFMVNGLYNSNGNTFTGGNARELQKKGGWIDTDIQKSPYNVLTGKWVYMLGDSTTRQVWASYAAPFQVNNFERNAKEWTRHYCNHQKHRRPHPKDKVHVEEGWRGACGVNEVTCHVSGYGPGGMLTYDWKHFPYEDYDEYLWGQYGPWIAGFDGEGARRPDVITLQSGLHTCVHSHNHMLGGSLKPGQINSSMVETHIASLSSLMQGVRTAVDLSNQQTNGNSTRTVIVLTSGAVYPSSGRIDMDACVERINRAAECEAHRQGFAVLERGELERRLMYKSLHTKRPILQPDTHLPPPAQSIVATVLLSLITCLEPLHMGTVSAEYLETLRNETDNRPDLGELHALYSPPD